jgi:glycosyltransferase involved in cell wall biosynthesis
VFMTADAVGGVWQYALDLAGGLRPHGVDVTLAVLGPDPLPAQQAMAEAAGICLISTGLPLDWVAATRSEVEAASESLSRIASQAKPDIIHLNSPALAATAVFTAPVIAVCHSCVATWWNAVRSGPLPDEFVWRTDLVRRGYRTSARLLAPTAAFANATAAAYGLEKPPLVVRNGRQYRPASRSPSSGTFAFTAGRLWDEGKNIAAIDRAAARLSIPVLAAGPLEGPNGAGIHVQHLSALGRLEDEEIRHHLSAKPIFISAARYEPFGLAVLEAAQSGCALVLSDIPTFRELWDGSAVFVPPDDDRAIAQAIGRLADDALLRTSLGQAAVSRAQTYTVEAMSAGVVDAYRSLLSPKGSRASVEDAAA